MNECKSSFPRAMAIGYTEIIDVSFGGQTIVWGLQSTHVAAEETLYRGQIVFRFLLLTKRIRLVSFPTQGYGREL